MIRIPTNLYGAWLADKSQIVEANLKAIERHWGGKFKHSKLLRIIDDSSQHLVVPLLVNHPNDERLKSFRCMVWIKIANKNERVCALFDLSQDDIESMSRPSEKSLHRIILMLLESVPILNLDDFEEVEVW